ncbi:MAG: hypothetical protein ABJB12_03250 [Pseudomonadota bacterium]
MGSTYQAIGRNLARLGSARFAARSRAALGLGLGISSALLLTLGCHASVSASANQRSKAEAEEGPDFDKPISADALASKAPPAIALTDTALLGARHDMTLVSEHANAACACLKAGIGSAQSAAFQWQGPTPHLNDDIQLAFAMTVESMACNNEPKGSSGASYWGYRISGNDVIIFVEGVRLGRPRTTAAIIPKPVGDGKVYVAPAKPKFPYGRSLDGKSERCEIGNAATKRTTPFTTGELGDTLLKDTNAAPSVDAEE